MRLGIPFFVLFLALYGQSFAQQIPLLSEYQHNATLLNPAMTGWEDATSLAATYRHQWTGMNRAPRTASLNFNYFADAQNMGFGGLLIHDQTGPTSFTGFQLSYAYHLKFKSEAEGTDKRHRLLLGLSLSGMLYRLRGMDLRYNDPEDPLIINANQSRFLPDAGAGIFYYNDLYYVGLSVPQLISLNVKFDDDDAISNVRRIAHFYFNAGAKLKVGKDDKGESDHHIIPSFWLKYAPSSPLNFTANVRYMWKKILQVGIGASTDGTLITDFNIIVKKQFRIGYGFSVGLNSLTRHIGTNHEIMLTYVFNSGGRGWFFEESSSKQSPLVEY